MQVSSTSYHGSKHLTEEELYAPATSCPWCNYAGRQTVATLQQSPLVTLEECPMCFATSASRMPTDKALADYYNSYYRDEKFEKAGARVTVGDARRMGVHLSQWMDVRDRNGVFRILDFGGGDGSVAAMAAESLLGRQPSLQRIEITVTDYNPVPADSPSQVIHLQHCPDLDSLPAGEFDFVIASAILEHIPESKKALERLLSLMRPGARFYARTPFVVPMLKLCRHLGVKLDFTFPAHLYDLGQFFWEKQFTSLDRRNVFRVIASRPSIVESTFGNSFVRTLAAHLCKLPWFLFGSSWNLVGGWEVAVERLKY
jgi:SAM-dependent methyltransferase